MPCQCGGGLPSSSSSWPCAATDDDVTGWREAVAAVRSSGVWRCDGLRSFGSLGRLEAANGRGEEGRGREVGPGTSVNLGAKPYRRGRERERTRARDRARHVVYEEKPTKADPLPWCWVRRCRFATAAGAFFPLS